MYLGTILEKNPQASPKKSLPIIRVDIWKNIVIPIPKIPVAIATKHAFLLPIFINLPPETAPTEMPSTILDPTRL